MVRRDKAGATTPRWNAQLDAEHDYPTVPTTTLYALCTTPRSGSHFLGHLLHRDGSFGYPLEYLNSRNLVRWEERARAEGQPDVLAFVKSVRTSPNGAFGIKLHQSHLASFLGHEDPQTLARYCFVHLRREDLVAQAVSFAWASQTKAWISDMPERDEAEYRYDLIAAKLQQIVADNAAWDAFLAARGLRTLAVTFEQARREPTAVVHLIADFVGVEPGPGVADSFMPAAQSSQGKDDWTERFREETRNRAKAGLSTPGDGAPSTARGTSRLSRSLGARRRGGKHSL